MSNSVSSQLLLDALAQCVRERFSKYSLDLLCDALEEGLTSSDDPRVELFEALTNYVCQLRDGAIQATADTTSLFHETRALLGEGVSSRQNVSFNDRVGNLLDRIDLAASGGFDALEAGEAGEFDRLVDSTSESLRTQNILHRMHAALDTIDRLVQVNHAGSATVASILSRHRRLIDSLAPPSLSSQGIPLATLAEMLPIQLTEITGELKVDEEGFVHPTYIPILSSLIARFAESESTHKVSDMRISQQEDAIEIHLTLLVGDSLQPDLRSSAIEHGFLNADAPIQDGDELQYALLPKTTQTSEQLIQSSELLNLLQSLCAKVVVESMRETVTVTATLPANIKLEDVTTFKLNGALYAILSESVQNVEYIATADGSEMLSSFKSEDASYQVISLSQPNGNHEAWLQIEDGENRFALFVDQIESPGQLPVFDSSTTNAHIGGGVCLLDRRLVVLLSTEEFADPPPVVSDPRLGVSPRLLVLGARSLVSQLSVRDYRVSYADGELDAAAAFQEQQPSAIVVDQHDLATYDRLLATADDMNVPVVVRNSGQQDLECNSSFSEFNAFTTLTELEAQLQRLTASKDSEQL